MVWKRDACWRRRSYLQVHLMPGVKLWTCFLISRVRGLDFRVSKGLASIKTSHLRLVIYSQHEKRGSFKTDSEEHWLHLRTPGSKVCPLTEVQAPGMLTGHNTGLATHTFSAAPAPSQCFIPKGPHPEPQSLSHCFDLSSKCPWKEFSKGLLYTLYKCEAFLL